MRRAAVMCAGTGAVILPAAGASLVSGPLGLARLLVLGGALGLLVPYDLREHRIPNRIVLPAACVCAALSLAEGVQQGAGLYLGATLVAALFAVSLAAPAALGMGDAKLALLILCALGGLASLALLIAVELYCLAGVALLIRHGRAAFKITLPLAPVIAAGCLITVLL